jgi:predicted HD superfamily hydrolase involved in NAD metabolism
MHILLAELSAALSFTGNIAVDVPAFLKAHGMEQTSRHCAEVAALSLELAQHFGVDGTLASKAGWLHDVSAVIPNSERIRFARELGLEILPEEVKLPMILHQKLSRVLALEIFHIQHPHILDAVECHTTLKKGARSLDKVVFIADKLAWDQPGTPPYADALRQALKKDLDAAVRLYLTYLWDQRESLPVVHPWLVEAVKELCCQV